MKRYEEIDDVLWRFDDNDIDDCNLFEKALWDAKLVCVIPGRPMYFEDEPYDPIPDAREYRLRIMEDMIEYYQYHHVSDDDLDTIQSVMIAAQEQEDFDPAVWSAAVNILDCHRVEYVEGIQTVVKSCDEVIDAVLRDGVDGRTWGQIGRGLNRVESVADEVKDCGPLPNDDCDTLFLKDRLRELLQTLTERERQVLDFRFGFTDGYSRMLEEVARLFNVTRERVRQVEARALRKLRHPMRMQILEEYRTVPLAPKVVKVVESEIVLEHNGDKYTMFDLRNLTHLPEHVIRRRIREQWSVERILTERIQPNITALRSVVNIGDIRFEIREWMETLGIQVEDLYSYVSWRGLNTDWRSAAIWKAVLKCLADRLRKEKRDYVEYLSLLGEGWSRVQIDVGRFGEFPQHYKSIILCINNRRARLSVWLRECNMTDDDVAACVRDEDGMIAWDVERVRAKIQDCIAERKRQRLGAYKIIWRGICRSRAEWAAATGIPETAIRERLCRGWHIDDVFTIPYPCSNLISVKGRHYTEEMFLERFGISHEEYMRSEQAEAAELKRLSEIRRAELVAMRRSERYEGFLKAKLRMADVEYTIREWLRLLNIPEENLEGKTDLYSFSRGADWCCRMRGVLRSMAKIGSNDQLNSIVKNGGVE